MREHGPPEATDISLRVLSEPTQNRFRDTVFGFAVHPGLASVYYEYAVRRAKSDDAEFEIPIILGCVIAHEVGHLLLGSNIPATTVVGVVGWIDPGMVPRPKPSAVLVWVDNGLFFAFILLGIFWVYRMNRLRWFALSIVLIQLWILMGVGFMTGMALSGDWL